MTRRMSIMTYGLWSQWSLLLGLNLAHYPCWWVDIGGSLHPTGNLGMIGKPPSWLRHYNFRCSEHITITDDFLMVMEPSSLYFCPMCSHQHVSKLFLIRWFLVHIALLSETRHVEWTWALWWACRSGGIDGGWWRCPRSYEPLEMRWTRKWFSSVWANQTRKGPGPSSCCNELWLKSWPKLAKRLQWLRKEWMFNLKQHMKCPWTGIICPFSQARQLWVAGIRCKYSGAERGPGNFGKSGHVDRVTRVQIFKPSKSDPRPSQKSQHVSVPNG